MTMTSEARDLRASNTDFSIARILADDRRCPPGALPLVDREVARKRRRHEVGRERVFRKTNVEEARIPERDETGNDAEHCVDVRCQDVPGRSVSPIVATGRRISAEGDDDESAIHRTDLTWLQYTRYRPPKLPRKSASEKRMKRRKGEHPRIPFSSSQLRVLEDRYERSAYLSKNDVIEMSTALRLPQSKIKIWFQNRRARQRRESLLTR